MEAEHADVERRLDGIALNELDTGAAAPMQEFGVTLDVVDEIEHLLRRVRNVGAALYCGQSIGPSSPVSVFFGGDSRIIAAP